MLRPRRSASSLFVFLAPVGLALAWGAASGVACANGSQALGSGGGTSQSASNGGVTSSSAGSGGSGGVSATASSSNGSTGNGGGGGIASSSATASSSVAGSCSSAASSSSSGGPGTTIFTAVAEGNAMACSYDNLSAMTGFTTPYQETPTTAIGLASVGDGTAIALVRSEPTGELRYARFTGSMWIPPFGDPLLTLMGGLVINGGPSLAGSSARAHAVYQGTDMNFYYAEELNGGWSPKNEPVAVGGSHSAGPVPPGITTLADEPVIAFIGNDGDLYDQTRTACGWMPPSAHGVAGHGASVTPAIVALTQGPELVIVYTDTAANALKYTLRTAGQWSTPAAVTGASSSDQVSLAPLAAGGAVLVYRGTDSLLYTSLLSASAPYTWSAQGAGVMGSSPTLQSPPAVATGATGAQAELLYLDTSFTLWSARMNNGAWGAAALSGAAQYRVAIATGN